MGKTLALYEHAPPLSPLSIISVPTELGSRARGLNKAPEYLRTHGLARMLASIGCDVSEEIDIPCRELTATSDATAAAVESAVRRGDTPLILGGDHSAAIGSMRGAAAAHRSLGVIYIDAHPDVNTSETSLTGHPHGMVAALAMEYLKPEHMLFLGLKDFDQAEIEFLERASPPLFTMLDVSRRGLGPLMSAIDELARKVDKVWVSMDVDSIDRLYAPGVAMQNDGGFTAREILSLTHYIGKVCPVAGIDLVEMLPANDTSGATAHLALDITARLLGAEHSSYSRYMDQYRETTRSLS